MASAKCYDDNMSETMELELLHPKKYRLRYKSKTFEIIMKEGRYWAFIVEPNDIRPLLNCDDKLEDAFMFIKEVY